MHMTTIRAAGFLTLATMLWMMYADAALELTDCRLQSSYAPGVVDAQCGTFEVLENPDNAGGRTIGVHVAIVPALARTALPDPVVIISGGPGQAASDFYLSQAGAFERLRRERELIVIDQRGTGRSNALECTFPDELDAARFDRAQLQRITEQCLAQLSGDPRYYTTSVAVRDLEAIRSELGYELLNLYGVSYGTRVAQHYLRHYPNRVRSLVLDGVVPVDEALGPQIAPAAQRALDAILARCSNDSSCYTRFPEVRTEIAALRAQLAQSSIPTTLPDPRTGQPTTIEFTDEHLAVVLRLLSYSDDTASLLPFLIHEAAAGRLLPMAAQALMVTRSLDQQLANGMHNAVVCTEDVPYFERAALADPAIRTSYIGGLFVEALQAMCVVWPAGRIDEGFHTPVQSDVPALLLSGEIDPVTPDSFGERAARSFSRGRHYVFPGQGHGQLTTRCGISLMAQFVSAGSADALNEACIAGIHPVPFMLDATGPGP